MLMKRLLPLLLLLRWQGGEGRVRHGQLCLPDLHTYTHPSATFPCSCLPHAGRINTAADHELASWFETTCAFAPS